MFRAGRVGDGGVFECGCAAIHIDILARSAVAQGGEARAARQIFFSLRSS